MELVESIERINTFLEREYGKEDTGRPIYRVVWSDDQLEKRLMYYTDAGIELLSPEVREIPKYRHFKHTYVLERLSYIPQLSKEQLEMTVNTISYEPIWTFVDKNLNPLPPRIDVCKIVIDSLHAAIYGDHSLAKYKDKGQGETLEERKERVSQIQKELFGNETDTGDALAYKEGVGYTGPSKIESEKVH